MPLNLCLFSVWVHRQKYILHTASITSLLHLQLPEKEEMQYLFIWSRKPTPCWLFFIRIPDNHAEQANSADTATSISITMHALILCSFLPPSPCRGCSAFLPPQVALFFHGNVVIYNVV